MGAEARVAVPYRGGREGVAVSRARLLLHRGGGLREGARVRREVARGGQADGRQAVAAQRQHPRRPGAV